MVELKKMNSKALNDPTWVRYQAIAEGMKKARNPSYLVVSRVGDLVHSDYNVREFENFWVAKNYFISQKEYPSYLIFVG